MRAWPHFATILVNYGHITNEWLTPLRSYSSAVNYGHSGSVHRRVDVVGWWLQQSWLAAGRRGFVTLLLMLLLPKHGHICGSNSSCNSGGQCTPSGCSFCRQSCKQCECLCTLKVLGHEAHQSLKCSVATAQATVDTAHRCTSRFAIEVDSGLQLW